MSTRRDAAQILAMVAWLRRQLNKIQDTANAEVDVKYPEERIAGSVDVDGNQVVVSSTVRVQQAPKLRVIDPVRFAEWVQQRWPTEIVPSVRPSFEVMLKQQMDANPAGVLVDDQGEVCEWVELAAPEPYTRTSLNKAADDALAPLLESRSLTDLVRFIETDESTDLDKAS